MENQIKEHIRKMQHKDHRGKINKCGQRKWKEWALESTLNWKEGRKEGR
jgi:hypothetical protein